MRSPSVLHAHGRQRDTTAIGLVGDRFLLSDLADGRIYGHCENR